MFGRQTVRQTDRDGVLGVDSLVGSVVFGSGGGGTFTGPMSLMCTRFITWLDR